MLKMRITITTPQYSEHTSTRTHARDPNSLTLWILQQELSLLSRLYIHFGSLHFPEAQEALPKSYAPVEEKKEKKKKQKNAVTYSAADTTHDPEQSGLSQLPGIQIIAHSSSLTKS